jgi:GTP pyrophosphokinase
MDKAYTQQILQMAEEVFQACEPRMSEDDMCRIRDGFQFAWNAHKKQVRRTGEPYIIHPISVALIVAKELNLDADTIIAAFLHDVVEDTDTTIEQIEERYGKDVAFLVNVVTKKKFDETPRFSA